MTERTLGHVTQTELAKLVGVSSRAVRYWIAAGCPRNADGTLDTGDVLAWRAAQRAAAEDTPLNRERARLAKEQADRIAADNERRRGELVEQCVIDDVWRVYMRHLRAHVLTFTERVLPDLHPGAMTPPEVQRVLERHVHELLLELSLGRASQAAADRRSAARRRQR